VKIPSTFKVIQKTPQKHFFIGHFILTVNS